MQQQQVEALQQPIFSYRASVREQGGVSEVPRGSESKGRNAELRTLQIKKTELEILAQLSEEDCNASQMPFKGYSELSMTHAERENFLNASFVSAITNIQENTQQGHCTTRTCCTTQEQIKHTHNEQIENVLKEEVRALWTKNRVQEGLEELIYKKLQENQLNIEKNLNEKIETQQQEMHRLNILCDDLVRLIKSNHEHMLELDEKMVGIDQALREDVRKSVIVQNDYAERLRDVLYQSGISEMAIKSLARSVQEKYEVLEISNTANAQMCKDLAKKISKNDDNLQQLCKNFEKTQEQQLLTQKVLENFFIEQIKTEKNTLLKLINDSCTSLNQEMHKLQADNEEKWVIEKNQFLKRGDYKIELNQQLEILQKQLNESKEVLKQQESKSQTQLEQLRLNVLQTMQEELLSRLQVQREGLNQQIEEKVQGIRHLQKTDLSSQLQRLQITLKQQMQEEALLQLQNQKKELMIIIEQKLKSYNNKVTEDVIDNDQNRESVIDALTDSQYNTVYVAEQEEGAPQQKSLQTRQVSQQRSAQSSPSRQISDKQQMPLQQNFADQQQYQNNISKQAKISAESALALEALKFGQNDAVSTQQVQLQEQCATDRSLRSTQNSQDGAYDKMSRRQSNSLPPGQGMASTAALTQSANIEHSNSTARGKRRIFDNSETTNVRSQSPAQRQTFDANSTALCQTKNDEKETQNMSQTIAQPSEEQYTYAERSFLNSIRSNRATNLSTNIVEETIPEAIDFESKSSHFSVQIKEEGAMLDEILKSDCGTPNAAVVSFELFQSQAEQESTNISESQQNIFYRNGKNLSPSPPSHLLHAINEEQNENDAEERKGEFTTPRKEEGPLSLSASASAAFSSIAKAHIVVRKSPASSTAKDYNNLSLSHSGDGREEAFVQQSEQEAQHTYQYQKPSPQRTAELLAKKLSQPSGVQIVAITKQEDDEQHRLSVKCRKSPVKGTQNTQNSGAEEEIVYQLDENGYLINENGDYIRDDEGNLIQLTEEHIEYLRASDLLEEVSQK